MEIVKITPSKFEEKINFCTLQVWMFGPLNDPDEDTQILATVVNGEIVAYLIADASDLWHIETKEGYTGRGYAKQLCEAARVTYAYEVCSDGGAALCEALGIEYDDCR